MAKVQKPKAPRPEILMQTRSRTAKSSSDSSSTNGSSDQSSSPKNTTPPPAAGKVFSPGATIPETPMPSPFRELTAPPLAADLVTSPKITSSPKSETPSSSDGIVGPSSTTSPVIEAIGSAELAATSSPSASIVAPPADTSPVIEDTVFDESSLTSSPPGATALEPEASVSAAAISSPDKVSSTSPPAVEQSPYNLRKRKASSSDDAETSRPPPKKQAQLQMRKDEDFQSFKSRVVWPEHNQAAPTYYQADGITPSGPLPNGAKVVFLRHNDPAPPKSKSATELVDADHQSNSETQSPKKSTRGGASKGRGGNSGNGGGRKNNKQKPKNGGAGGGRDSPDPPFRKAPLTQDERVEISMLKARQHELKKFFSAVGNQQLDILDKLATKDLTKLANKPKAHKHLPEYDEVTEELAVLMAEQQENFRKKREIEVNAEKVRMEAEREVIEQQYRTRVNETKKEHLAGAQGDIILFERAYRAAHDDTHTETGSDMDYFPHYHECPEPNARPRGYVSNKIMDEKPFMSALETSYDDQAVQQVLEQDVINPLLRQIEERNNEWREEAFRRKTMNMDTLSEEAAKELETIKGYLIPRPFEMMDSNSYSLSALADVAEWTAQRYPEHHYIHMPLAPGDIYPRQGLDFSPRPGGISAPPPLSLPPLAPPPPPTTRLLSASGPGQAIAPAPPKPVTRSSSVSSASLPPPPPSSSLRAARLGSQSTRPTAGNGPQQFIFQPPQQPLQHQAAPGPSPTAQYGPTGTAAGAVPIGQQTKIPMTFINSTIKVSRNAAAASAGGNAGVGGSSVGVGGGVAPTNVKGGQRMLLPKMQQ
ncbi:hypothetical protein LTR84_008832 [Exophiala bonariae]|uniref:GLTSCR protein conserved domain-containing protein n=1 Tax=Exophiala bonariae TaxID=1690606 RepID=A0AAV9MVR9_9EURO|nr:hypothetical protein LTR84_008832 [Exophiala bonariae]